jgi:hypothetical protein
MMFMIMLRLQQLAAPAQTLELAPLWEVAKGLMLFLSTALLSWIAKTVAQVRTSQRDQLHILKGVDGDGGFKKDIAGLESHRALAWSTAAIGSKGASSRSTPSRTPTSRITPATSVA